MIKKLFKISTLIVCMACSLFVFAGCNTALKGGPAVNDYVYGNGGLAVMKGDYVYYVNGYTSYSKITSADKNKQGTISYSGIFRTKLVNGKLSYKYDERDTEQKYSHTLEKTERVVSKVAGHESTGLYIFDNYIYYSSPNTDKDNSGTVKNEYLDFYRCNLNGTGNTHLFKTQTYSENQSYTFAKIDNTVYLICYDGTNLTIVNTKNKTKKQISDSVQSVAFNKQVNYFADSHNVTEMEKYVYYVCANEDDKAEGNVFAKVNISTGEKTIIDNSNASTYTLCGMGNDTVVYTKVNSLISSSNGSVYAFNGSHEKELYANVFNKIEVIDSSSSSFEGIIGTSNYFVYHISETGVTTQLLNIETKDMFVSNNNVYVSNANNEIYKVDISNPSDYIKIDNAKINMDNKIYMSAASSYLFFFAGYENDNGTSYYLNMSNTTSVNDGKCESSFIGLFNKADKPTETYEE